MNPAWSDLGINEIDQLITTIGGKERFHSVLNGLIALENSVSDDDWILVHDAARPCLEMKDVDKLINTLCEHPHRRHTSHASQGYYETFKFR